jgi:hypothetical protein
MQTLKRLDIAKNEIRDEGAKYLADALEVNEVRNK